MQQTNSVPVCYPNFNLRLFGDDLNFNFFIHQVFSIPMCDMPNQQTGSQDWTELSTHYAAIIQGIGENSQREGLARTPERAAKAMRFLTQGYGQDPKAVMLSAIFKEDYSEMVLVKDIEIYSMCEHHLLPFFGKAHIAYIPNGQIVGLSKLPRVVDIFARRLQVQERLTMEILECVQQTLQPLGAAVIIEAQHMCMMMRGVEKQNSSTTTSAFTGEFKNESTRAEFLNLIYKSLR